MQNRQNQDQLLKIAIPVVQNSAGFPPLDVEWVWAKRHPGSVAEIDNVPFFSHWAFRDLIEFEAGPIGLVGSSMNRSSGNSTLLVECQNDVEIGLVRTVLRQSSIAHEAWAAKRLLAINIDCGGEKAELLMMAERAGGPGVREFEWRGKRGKREKGDEGN